MLWHTTMDGNSQPMREIMTTGPVAIVLNIMHLEVDGGLAIALKMCSPDHTLMSIGIQLTG